MEYRTYDLSHINNININSLLDISNDDNKINLNNIGLTYKSWIKNNKIYNIFKYDRSKLSIDMINNIGIWRSVVYSNNQINVFSPPKSENINIFSNKYIETDCIAQEFVEGTMINLFYDKDINNWEISSKSSVGGNVTFFQDQPTFSELFNDICSELNIDLTKFSKDYSYSLIIQHPKNKFVIPVKEKKLYLISMYKIDNINFKVTEFLSCCKNNLDNPIMKLDNDILTKLSFPEIYKFDSYYKLYNEYASMNTDIYTMGIVLYHKSGDRSKLRNPNYEYVKHLRGNNTKLQYQYLSLRKLNSVKECLKYFPENQEQFNVFRSQLHLFTNSLYKNYINCYIHKEKPLKEFSPQFKTHMYNLHQLYLSMREDKGYINKYIVINYVNNLEPAKLMYTLNYYLHKISSN